MLEGLRNYNSLLEKAEFKEAYKIRTAARNKILEAPLNQFNLERKITTCLEIGDFESAKKLLSFHGSNRLDPKYRKDVEFFIQLFDRTLVPLEDTFGDYIKDKRIAIIGSSANLEANGLEIDSFDLVVRINYHSENLNNSPADRGSRCDIVYFNGGSADTLKEISKPRLPDKIKWVVLKNSRTQDYLSKNNPKINFRRLITYKSNTRLKGHYTMVQNIVLDLLHYKPKYLKVFGSDLFLTINRYKGYYDLYTNNITEAERNLPLKHCWGTAHCHDPVMNYNILYNLKQAGLIDGDDRFNEVMNLKENLYMEELEKTYKPAILKVIEEDKARALKAIEQKYNPVRNYKLDVLKKRENYRVGVVKPTQNPYIFKLATSIEKAGNTLVVANTPQELVGVDFALLWSMKKYPYLEVLDKNRTPFLVAEMGFLGDRSKEWHSLGWGDINGKADFCNKFVKPDRAALWRPKLKPWKTSGSYILLCGQVLGDYTLKNLHQKLSVFYSQTAKKLMEAYGMPVVFRPHPKWCPRDLPSWLKVSTNKSLEEDLNTAWLTVAWSSNSLVESIMNGCPTLAFDPIAMTWDISIHSIGETPILPDRQEWLNRISYAQWSTSELEDGTAWNHVKKYLEN